MNPFEEGNISDNGRIVDFPKEIRILGKISRVRIEGNELYQDIIFDQNDKKKKKTYVIVPVKSQNSVVQFVKIPLFKMSRPLKAKKIGAVICQKINPFETENSTEKLKKWSSEKKDLLWEEPDPQAETGFSLEEVSTNPQSILPEPKPEQPKDEDKQTHPEYKTEPNELQTQNDPGPRKESFRLLSYLITEKNKNNKKQKYKKDKSK